MQVSIRELSKPFNDMHNIRLNTRMGEYMQFTDFYHFRIIIIMDMILF